MSAQTIGLLSGGLVIASIVPYAIRVYERKIHPVPTSWILWSFIALAILLTYRSSGAEANMWPVVFGFFNPTIIVILSVWRHEKWKKLNEFEPYEWLCLVFGILSIVMWLFMRQSQELSQYALYVAIVADTFAAIPTVILFKKEPEKDRPFSWFLFGVGYVIALFSITERTFANYALPIYLVAGSFTVTLLLVIPRIRRGIPLKEWI